MDGIGIALAIGLSPRAPAGFIHLKKRVPSNLFWLIIVGLSRICNHHCGFICRIDLLPFPSIFSEI